MSDRQEGWLHTALSNILLIVTIGTVGAVGLAAWNFVGLASSGRDFVETLDKNVRDISKELRLVTVDEDYIGDLKHLVVDLGMRESPGITECLNKMELFVKQHPGRAFVDRDVNSRFWASADVARNNGCVTEGELQLWIRTLMLSLCAASQGSDGTLIGNLHYAVYHGSRAAEQANGLVQTLPGQVDEQIDKFEKEFTSRLDSELALINGILHEIDHVVRSVNNGVDMFMGESEEVNAKFVEDVYTAIRKVKEFADGYNGKGELSDEDKLLIEGVFSSAIFLQAQQSACGKDESICLCKADIKALRQLVDLLNEGQLNDEQFANAVKILHGDCKNFIRRAVRKSGENKAVALVEIVNNTKTFLEALAYRGPGVLRDIECLVNAASNSVAMCMGESKEIDDDFVKGVYAAISKVKEFADGHKEGLSAEDKSLIEYVFASANTLKAQHEAPDKSEGDSICLWKTYIEELRQFVALVGKDKDKKLSEKQFIEAVEFLRRGDCKNFIRGVIFKVGENKMVSISKFVFDLNNKGAMKTVWGYLRNQYSQK